MLRNNISNKLMILKSDRKKQRTKVMSGKNQGLHSVHLPLNLGRGLSDFGKLLNRWGEGGGVGKLKL